MDAVREKVAAAAKGKVAGYLFPRKSQIAHFGVKLSVNIGYKYSFTALRTYNDRSRYPPTAAVPAAAHVSRNRCDDNMVTLRRGCCARSSHRAQQ